MNDLQEILEGLGLKAQPIKIGERTLLALPPDWSYEDMERLLPQPYRIRTEPMFVNQQSFCEYVNRFKNDDSWINLVASERGATAVAFLDYHGPKSGPSWNAHRATYNAKHSEAWNIWSAKNNKAMTQSDFADFIYDNQADVSGMPGADLLEIVQRIKATAKSEYRDMQERNGSVDMIYRTKISMTDAATDKVITFPTETEITIPMYEGGDPVRLKVDFKIKKQDTDKGGVALFAYRLYRPDTVVLNHHLALKEALKEATKLPVWS